NAETPGGVVLWEVATAKQVWAKPLLLRGAAPVIFTAAEKLVLLGGAANPFVLLDAADGKEARLWGGHKAAVTGVALAPDGKTLFTASADHTIKRWDAATGKEVQTFKAHTDVITSLALSTDGKQLLSGSADK